MKTTMLEQWQPYPNHPQVRLLTRLLADLQEQAVEALAQLDSAVAQRLLDEIESVRTQLSEISAELLGDEALLPHWSAHTEADAASGAIPCLECGNNIPAGERQCSYCGWTYLETQAADASP